METIKAGRPTVQFVRLCYAANRSLMLMGRHGVGKSELLELAAKEMGIGFISRDLSLMEPPDLVGLPKISRNVTTYLPPSFLPRSGNGILLLEELNRAERYMRASCLQLLTARTLNDYQLPPGWLPAAAINPSAGDYDTFDLDPALLSRFIQVTIEPDREEWLEWAGRHGIHLAVIGYVEHDPSAFDPPHGCPRSWKYVSDIVSAAENGSFDSRTLRAAVVGAVGNHRGAAFLRTLRNGEHPLSAKVVLASYHRHQAQVRHWVANGKLDLVKATLLDLEKYLQPKSDFDSVRSDSQAWNRLAAFLQDLPGDLRNEAMRYFAERKYAFPTF